jgi:dTDP-4-dehydrorhamnose 3,5-epimerase
MDRGRTDARKCNQLWVPTGFAHGFCTLKPDTIVAYKVTQYYSPDHDKGVMWNDPAIGVAWPDLADPATLSARTRCSRCWPTCPLFQR